MGGAPWFRFYASDWLGSPTVQMMTAAERGIYVQLLAASWEHGPLPTEERLLARLGGVSLAELRKAWPAVEPCFDPVPDGLINPRLEVERTRSIERSSSCAESAAISVKRRRRKQANAIANAGANAPANAPANGQRTASRPDPDPVPEKDLSPSSPSSAPTGSATGDLFAGASPPAPAGPPVDLEAALEEVYARYPRKEGKTPGLKVAKREIKTPEDLALLGAAVDRYAAQMAAEGRDRQFMLHFGTFMGRWRDWSAPAEEEPTGSAAGPMERELDDYLAARERARVGVAGPGDEETIRRYLEKRAPQRAKG